MISIDFNSYTQKRYREHETYITEPKDSCTDSRRFEKDQGYFEILENKFQNDKNENIQLLENAKLETMIQYIETADPRVCVPNLNENGNIMSATVLLNKNELKFIASVFLSQEPSFLFFAQRLQDAQKNTPGFFSCAVSKSIYDTLNNS